METRGFDKRIFFGAILLLIGFLILGTNLGFISYNIRHILLSWRMLVIVIGLSQLLFTRNKAIGVLLIAVGTFFYLPEFMHLPFRVRDLFWPIIIIALGLMFIFRQAGVPGRQIDSSSGDFIDDVAIFGGSEKVINSQNFQGGKITAAFGGSTFIFSSTRLSPMGAVLDVFTIFGGSKYVVPRDWNVRIEVTALFGGFTDKRIPNPQTDYQKPELVIKGLVIFGGGEVVNY